MNSLLKNLHFAIMLAIAASTFSNNFPLKSIYDINVRDINGGNLGLKKFKGKKMVFVIISGTESDSALGQLSAFCTKYKDSAVFIGVLSNEDGYSESNKQTIKKRFKEYKKLDIELTEGMHTKKTSANQSELMEWLTRKEQNQHFDNDVSGLGQKFFVDESGDLYAVIGPKTTLSSPVIQRILSRPPRL